MRTRPSTLRSLSHRERHVPAHLTGENGPSRASWVWRALVSHLDEFQFEPNVLGVYTYMHLTLMF